VRRAAVALAVVAAVACSGGSGDDGSGARKEEERVPRDHASTTTTAVAGPESAAVPRTVAAVAATLTRVERALRAPDTPPADLARLGWEQQNAYRALAAHGDWLSDVLAEVPADVAPVVTANERAVRQLTRLGEPQASLPDWQIAAPPSPEVLRSYYAEAEAASGIPWAYFASIHLVETRLSRIRGTSTAGAQGPMQFIPATWERYGQGDINDTRDAILAAARLLGANGAPGDISRALFRYNNSLRYVDAVQAYAQLMLADERAFLGYYQWQVDYATTAGTYVLPEGYPTQPARRVGPPRP
jgi:Transglycosylase SLT domain